MHRVLSPRLATLGEILARGPSAAAGRLRSSLARVADTPNTTILLEGERGTRRSAIAAYVHALSARADAPLVLACAPPGRSLGDGLGAAVAAAADGTLVVDRPERLAAADQERLSHLLAERTWTDADGAAHAFDARLVALVDDGFDAAQERGVVSRDLAYRLNVLRVELPPLRRRTEDLPALLEGLGELEDAQAPRPHVDPEAVLGAVDGHPWPGNLRELEAAWNLATARAVDGRVDPSDLLPVTAEPPEEAPEPADATLKGVEERWIRRILAREGGNRSRAARVLGIHRATLYNKLREYGIDG